MTSLVKYFNYSLFKKEMILFLGLNFTKLLNAKCLKKLLNFTKNVHCTGCFIKQGHADDKIFVFKLFIILRYLSFPKCDLSSLHLI